MTDTLTFFTPVSTNIVYFLRFIKSLQSCLRPVKDNKPGVEVEVDAYRQNSTQNKLCLNSFDTKAQQGDE